MRRFTATILFLLLLVMGLFGSDIVAYGYGSTEAMARKAAFDALSQMVFGDVEVFSDESFEPLPSVIQEVWLTAEKAEQKKGIYCSSATIPESAAETFFSEMEKLNSEIVHGYASLSGMEDYFSLID
ncbi:MAG: hypothetical protein II753_06505, partial [Spirochaetales bacterium]|nr:hypothetical protein [Spirochaetales bacterium]